MERLLLIDGHSLIYRSYYAFIRNPLKDLKGRNTSAIFGFVNTLKKIETEFKPKYMGVVFDTQKPTFRHKEYVAYKIQRPETPGDLRWQVPVIKEIAKAWGIKTVEIEGFEADDVLATIAKKMAKKDFQVIIVSGDKDLMQIISDKILVYDSYRNILYTPEKVKEKFGVDPSKIADILALEGDTIDNIPGVPGIGEKRARQIIEKYGSVEEACEKDELCKKYRDVALMSKNLVKLREIPQEFEKNDFLVGEKNIEFLISIYKDLNFSSLLKELTQGKKLRIEITNDFLPILNKDFSVIFSTQGAFVSDGERCAYVRKESQDFKRIIENDVTKYIFDYKSTLPIIESIKGRIFDVKLAEWVLEPDKKIYELGDMMIYYTGSVSNENEARCAAIYRIGKVQEQKITEYGLEHVFFDIEIPLSLVLFDMEKRGVKIDIPHFKNLSGKFSGFLWKLEQEIHQLAGTKFNVNSPKQLAEVLFTKLKLPPKKRTKTGYSTDIEVLEELAEEYEIARKIVEYRQFAKIKSTYLDPLVEYADEDSRIHTTFDQTGTSTGRLSTKNPNLQNIPIKGRWGKDVRKGFVAEEGFLLISADYSQIELRILAHITDDENLKEIFFSGRDIHTETAAKILGKKDEEVTQRDRRLAKMVNYGIVYGISEHGLAVGLRISHHEAKEFISKYLSTFPKVKEWREKVVEEARNQGFTQTIFGRIRKVPGLYSKNKNIKEAAERATINMPVQGSAADIIKKGMIEIHKLLKKNGFEGGIVLQIHDELLLEIEEKRIEEAKEIVKDRMEKVVRLRVPLEVNIEVGKNWMEAH